MCQRPQSSTAKIEQNITYALKHSRFGDCMKEFWNDFKKSRHQKKKKQKKEKEIIKKM